MMSVSPLRWNTIANYLGLGYATAIGIVVYPLYLHYLGAEVFGLIGFFTVLQAWMLMLDLGMSPMLSRQVAEARGANAGFLDLRKLLRSLELFMLALSAIIVLAIALGSNWITSHWLQIATLDLNKVAICIGLMGVMIAMRLFGSLYRSGIQGMENQVALNLLEMAFISLKFIGALLLLKFLSQDYLVFFVYQLLIGTLELILLAAMFYKFLPASEKIAFRFYWDTLKPRLPFVGGLAFAVAIWVVLTQLDKLILSNVLPLSEYGYFALVAIVTTGITQFSGPVSKAILPRLTLLIAQGREQEMLALYKKSTQFMAVVMLPLAGMIAVFSSELLYAWTGDKAAAQWGGPILFWFALGNGILALSAFQYYLQFAHGKLKMHVRYSAITACFQIPIIVYSAYTYGALGVAIAWFSIRLVLFIIWTPIVHSKFAPGLHWRWLLQDVMPFVVLTGALLVLAKWIGINFIALGRLEILLTLAAAGLIITAANILASSACRAMLGNIFGPKLKET